MICVPFTRRPSAQLYAEQSHLMRLVTLSAERETLVDTIHRPRKLVEDETDAATP